MPEVQIQMKPKSMKSFVVLGQQHSLLGIVLCHKQSCLKAPVSSLTPAQLECQWVGTRQSPKPPYILGRYKDKACHQIQLPVVIWYKEQDLPVSQKQLPASGVFPTTHTKRCLLGCLPLRRRHFPWLTPKNTAFVFISRTTGTKHQMRKFYT